jgi:nitrogen regulatory protein PII
VNTRFPTRPVFPKAVAIIVRAAKTGKIGDGKVFVVPLEDGVRVPSDERAETYLCKL